MNADYTFRAQWLAPKLPLTMLNHFDLTLQSGERDISPGSDAAELCLVQFLEQLELPQLRSLSLRWLVAPEEGERHWSEVHPRFISILSSVAPTLRSLSVAYLPLTDEQALECLMQLHCLSHLDLRFSLVDREHDPITDVFLEACTPRLDKSSPTILPLLEAVYLQCNGAQHSATQVVDLIQSRWMSIWGSVHLRSFSLISMKPVSAHTRQRMKKWSEEGLEVFLDQVDIR
ncbi:hypothetical protein D9615_000028 [Tricholomella constricta]|uniref:Uncharacterized protein n=1 Tax=Tricholomella constricta TaxID=117010 RepID=A0A8H5MBD7_9AGAR|nr:hypothetical protein D9615_000028 [Tricholomella constricta]